MDFNSFIKSRDEISQKLNDLRNEIKKVNDEYLSKVSLRKKEIEKTIEKIDKNFLSINLERSLILLPNNAVGSKGFGIELNKKSSLYDNTQFNKIIRFLTFIETSEAEYNSFYTKMKKSYLIDPNLDSMKELINLNRVINYEYSLMNILCDKIDNNKVEFNKIYNAIEDRGVFQTASEKFQNSMLLKISGSLEDIVDRIDTTNENLNEISFRLWDIDENISSSTDKIVNHLGSLESSVQAGNALSLAQNYQLYRINSNIKKIGK